MSGAPGVSAQHCHGGAPTVGPRGCAAFPLWRRRLAPIAGPPWRRQRSSSLSGGIRAGRATLTQTECTASTDAVTSEQWHSAIVQMGSSKRCS